MDLGLFQALIVRHTIFSQQQQLTFIPLPCILPPPIPHKKILFLGYMYVHVYIRSSAEGHSKFSQKVNNTPSPNEYNNIMTL